MPPDETFNHPLLNTLADKAVPPDKTFTVPPLVTLAETALPLAEMASVPTELSTASPVTLPPLVIAVMLWISAPLDNVAPFRIVLLVTCSPETSIPVRLIFQPLVAEV